MSEAELHVLRARLRGGILNKARRGELVISPPVGLIYNCEGALVLDPDKHVQQCLRLLFETFRSTGSAMATLKAFQRQGLQFPRRVRTGAHKGDLVWAALGHTQVSSVCARGRACLDHATTVGADREGDGSVARHHPTMGQDMESPWTHMRSRLQRQKRLSV